MTTQSPRTLGRYEITREIGRGGFATVYQASDSVLGRQIALKLLHPARLDDPQTVARFRAEARITSQLIHPNIVIVHDAGEIDGQFFIAMQYVAGRNLGQIMADDKAALMPFDSITALLRQIGPALDYAHAHGAIHRDVKPSNILMDARGQAYLSDFGIAKALGTSTTTGMSVFGQVIGTPNYFSPEQAEGKVLDGRSDLYSLAVVVYELCSGVVPFQSETLASLIHRIVYDPPPAPATLNARVVEPIAGVLMKALAKSPEDRFPTGQAFADAFSAAVQTVREDILKAHLAAAVDLTEKKDFDGAESHLREVLNFEPMHAVAGEAIVRLRNARIEHLLEVADKELVAGDLDAAEDHARSVLAREPRNARATALMTETVKRRKWQARYDAISTELSALIEATSQLDADAPRAADPDGVFRRLLDEVEPAASAKLRTYRLVQRLLAAAIALGIIVATIAAISLAGATYVVPSEKQFQLIMDGLRGATILGVGLGTALVSVIVLFLLSWRPPK